MVKLAELIELVRERSSWWFEEEFTGAIIFCPVCVTNVDAENFGWNVIECSNCGTVSVVFLEATKLAEYSGVG